MKAPSQSEREGDKISHKNTSSVTSYFLVRLFLSNGSQAMSEFTHSMSVCVSMHMCVHMHVCVSQKESLREAKSKVRKLTFVEFKSWALG